MSVARSRLGLLAASLVFVAGCASLPRVAERAASEDVGPWSGRLALQVEGSQSQSFAAGFDLKGNAATGELTLTNPLGGTLAVLSWAPGSAVLRNGAQAREFPSVDALVVQATGSSIPLAALFDWLRGTNTPVPGWQANLALLPQGRLSAHRTQPQPEADLRIALER